MDNQKLKLNSVMHPPYVEQIGSGIKRMRNLLKEANLPSPKFEMNSHFIVVFKRKEPLSEPVIEPLIEPLSEPLKKILEFISKNKKINRPKIINQLGFSRATTTRHLSELKKKGLIKYIGSKKKGYYEIINKNENKTIARF